MPHILSRRGLLGALAVATAAFRRWLPARAADETPESDKITHADAHYQLVPKGQQRCEICLQFAPPSHCQLVRAPIYPKGWCQYFAARENAH